MAGSSSSEPRITHTPISLPAGGGAVSGIGETFQPNEFSGTASLSIPISITPCRGFEPTLSIDYSSGSGNGIFGLGFDVAIAAISRKTSKGLPSYSEDDTFLLSGSEDLVPVEDKTTSRFHITRYQPRLEGLFARIEQYTDIATQKSYWQVVTKENITHLYGYTPAARICDPENEQHIYQWLLEESIDAHGNHICYRYKGENLDGISDESFEKGRSHSANKYIQCIQYGNKTPSQQKLIEQPIQASNWHFEILFDYGEFDVDPANLDPYTPVQGQVWKARPDSFSTYNAGFEIRTHRLCRNILMFHRFENEFGQQPILVGVTQFGYEENLLMSRLKSVTHIGYRYHKGEKYKTKRLPPLTFGYIPFHPNVTPYPLEAVGHNSAQLIGVNQSPNYQLIDLYGEGLPGVLYEDGQTALYWEPQGAAPNNGGTVSFATPTKPPTFPMNRHQGMVAQHLLDLNGNGRPDLIWISPATAGYFESNPDTSWTRFQPFRSFPTDYLRGNYYMVDVTGDGLADIVLIEGNRVKVYPSLGLDGYGQGVIAAQTIEHPLPKGGSPIAAVQFADIFGTGQQHLIRITRNQVECWPNLGGGRFGDRIILANAPDLGASFTTDRLLLADIDGSGTLDIVYLPAERPDQIDIWFNQAGNSFADEPLVVTLPHPYDRLDQISFADLFGNGTNCLIFSELASTPRHWFYDFCSQQKPYLLNEIDNNMGVKTEITYKSSVSYYLEDKQNGFAWITTLPFPVQVVSQIQHHDLINKNLHVISYRYHHGFYDPFERNFQGFGCVERVDTNSFAALLLPENGDDAAYRSPPRLTKTWYHTGAWLEDMALEEQYKKEYWLGDPTAPLDISTAFLFEAEQPDDDDKREAYRALHGAVQRVESYGIDGTPWQNNPYSVTETQFKVIQLRRRENQKYGVFLTHDQQSISLNYERNPADPRVEHSFVLNVDHYGEVLERCTIHYGRRAGQQGSMDRQTRDQQAGIRALYHKDDYLHVTNDFYLIGMPLSQKSYELKGITATSDYLTVDEVSGYIAASFSSNQIQLLSWTRDYYYDADLKRELPFGQITAQHLHCRTEVASLEKSSIRTQFQDTPVPLDLDRILSIGDNRAVGGYIVYQGEEEGNYYWNPGITEIYAAAVAFYQPQAEYWNLSKQFGTTYFYDPYYLAVVKLVDALGNETSAEIDYQILQPWQIVDANSNRTEVRFDPLGRVIASSFYGAEGKDVVGFGELATFQDAEPQMLETLLADPIRYLAGQAASYYYYDLDAWAKRKEPVYTVQVTAESYSRDHTTPLATATSAQIHITYFDGFGRTLQVKAKVTEPGEAFTKIGETYHLQQDLPERWRTTGAVRYNHKGKAIQQFEPYFVDTTAYTPYQVGVSTTLFYDALDRETLLEIPINADANTGTWLTCFSKTLYGSVLSGEAALPTEDIKGYLNQKLFAGLRQKFVPSAWSILHFDENQTLAESTYYKAVMDDTPLAQLLPPHEKETLRQTVLFHNHISQHILDNLERTVEAGQINAGDNEIATVAGSQRYYLLDILGDSITESDPQRHSQNKVNFELGYDLVKQVVKTISADAGTQWSLHDINGNPILTQDSRGTVTKHSYDPLHRLTQVHVENRAEGLDQVVEIIIYGDSQRDGQPLIDPTAAKQWNLRGEPIIHFDQSGFALSGFYTIHGLPLAVSRCLHKVLWQNDRLMEVDWRSVDDAILRGLVEALLQVTPATARALSLSGIPLPNVESDLYTVLFGYDALDRPIREVDPDGSTTNITYNSRSLVQTVFTIPGAQPLPNPPAIKHLTYNAKGQQESIVLGSDVEIRHGYDPFTFQLRTTHTTRPAGSDLQDLTYTYDQAGNVTYVSDNVMPTTFYKGAVSPDSAYTYDSLYRLISASGREQAGMVSNVQQNRNRSDQTLFRALANELMNPQAVRRYTQTFAYDTSGNLTRSRHSIGSTQEYQIQAESNRLQSSKVADKRSVTYRYDANGNQQTLVRGQSIYWNYRNNIQSVTLVQRQGQPDDVEGYVYDSSGQRVRKLRRVLTGRGSVQQVTEVIYLGHFEIRRSWQAPAALPYDSGSPKSEWHWNRMGGGHHDRCRWGYQIRGSSKAAKSAQIRYGLMNHLGSSTAEINEQAEIISYEAYYPYGGTAFTAAKGKGLRQARIEVKAKYYRYSGKELDEATGLYYYGMRYYSPWLCRWLSPDPAGTIDGLNLYAFVSNNPASHVDERGLNRTRKSRDRVAKREPVKHSEMIARMRTDATRQRHRDQSLAAQKERRQKEVDRARKGGRRNNLLTREQLSQYPRGSHAHTYFLYLDKQLEALNTEKGLISHDNAYVESDHAPNDASQTPGRSSEQARLYRVAVPLPRLWHRRHKTTHGPNATRHDASFVAAQKDRVQAGRYAEALQEHLLETFSSGAIASTGIDKISLVAQHTLVALDYAASGDIAVSIHKGHRAYTPAISHAEHTSIKTALRARFTHLATLPKYHGLPNPF